MGASDIRVGGAFVEIGGDDRSLDNVLKGARAKTKAFADNIGNLGKKLVGIGAAITAPALVAIKSFADLETGLAKVSTLLDESQEAEFLPGFQKGIRRLSVDLGEATDSLTRGLFDIISASIEPSKALNVLETAAKAAAGGVTDTGTAADAITTILNSFSLSAERAGDVADFLAVTAKLGKTDFDRLAGSIGRVASSAAISGVSFEELGAAIAVTTRASGNTEQSITSLDALLKAFGKSSDDSAEVANKFGLSLSASAIATDGLFASLAKLKGVDADILRQIFPETTAFKAAAQILQNIDAGLSDVDKVANRTGASLEAFSDIQGTLNFKANQLRQGLKDLVTQIGIPLADTALNLISRFKGIVKQVKAWVKENPKLIQNLFNIGLKLIGLGTLLISAAFAAKTFLFILSPAGLMGAAILAIGVLLEKLGFIDVALGFIADGAKIAGVSIFTWIGNIWIEVLKLFENAKAGFLVGFESIAFAGRNTWNLLKLGFAEAAGAIAKIALDLAAAIVNALTGAVKFIQKRFLELKLASGIIGFDEFNQEMKAIENRVSGAQKFIRNQQEKTSNFWQASSEEARSAIENDLTKFEKKREELFGNANDAIKSLQEEQIRNFEDAMKGMEDSVKGVTSEISKLTRGSMALEEAILPPRGSVAVTTGDLTPAALGTFTGAIGGQFKATGVLDQLLITEKDQLQALNSIDENIKEQLFGLAGG